MDLNQMLAPYELTRGQLDQIISQYQKELSLGLSTDPTQGQACVAMLPSFVPELPDSTKECGKFLAMDLGGTNLTLLLLDLDRADGQPNADDRQTFPVPEDARTGSAEGLFDFIVNCVETFVVGRGLGQEELPLGFVFSYPCDQTSLTSSKLLWWTKEFSAQGVIGQDVVKLLQQAFERNQKVKVRVVAIMNDTVGLLASAAFDHGPDCTIGAVSVKIRVMAIMNDTVGILATAAFDHGPDCTIGVGVATGCNAAYVEDTAKILKLNHSSCPFSKMIIDTEWEEFGNHGQLDHILTDIDRDLDKASVHPGKQSQDKVISGLHLGELVRRLLLKIHAAGCLQLPPATVQLLNTEGCFPAKFISTVLSDSCDGDFPNTRSILAKLEMGDAPSTNVIQAVYRVCHVLSLRSASVLAAAIAGLLTHMKPSKVKIGLGGTLYDKHPLYKQMLTQKLTEIAPPSVQWSLVHAVDGSGKGAALVAAIAARLKLD